MTPNKFNLNLNNKYFRNRKFEMKKQQMASRSSNRDYSRGNNHRQGSQSRGASRGPREDKYRASGVTQSQNYSNGGQQYNTIQHSKNVMPTKPSAQIGNFLNNSNQKVNSTN